MDLLHIVMVVDQCHKFSSCPERRKFSYNLLQPKCVYITDNMYTAESHYRIHLLLGNCLCVFCADFFRCLLVSSQHQQGDEVGLGPPSTPSDLGPLLVPPGLCPADELLHLCHQQIHTYVIVMYLEVWAESVQ